MVGDMRLSIADVAQNAFPRHGYRSASQTEKNLAWFLPRPKPDRYKGGMPRYAEEWLIDLARDIIEQDKIRLLNIFCGMNKYGLRVDVRDETKPHVQCDVHRLSEYLDPARWQFDVVIADPPYSNEESKDLYGTPPLKYKKWTKECDKFLRPGGLLIIYHKLIMPNPDPENYTVVKRVFIGNRTMHLPRVCIVFQKLKQLPNF
jgi:16S rRNA G966 N2-methylase RsmD